MRKTKVYLLLAICLLIGTSFLSLPEENTIPNPPKDEVNSQDTFPVPARKKNMIFYVQRTLNTNTIIYELNYNKDSTLNKETPVNINWIRYAEDGSIKELSYFQRKYAYGLNVVCIDSLKPMYKLNFVSYKKRDIFLARGKSGKLFKATIIINNKPAYIHKVFVRIDGGTFWVPHITYVEIVGNDILTGKAVSEKIIP